MNGEEGEERGRLREFQKVPCVQALSLTALHSREHLSFPPTHCPVRAPSLSHETCSLPTDTHEPQQSTAGDIKAE